MIINEIIYPNKLQAYIDLPNMYYRVLNTNMAQLGVLMKQLGSSMIKSWTAYEDSSGRVRRRL